jgi:hypothetical protein
MTSRTLIDLLTSRAFLAIGTPLLAVGVELIVRLNAKADDDPAFSWTDLDYGASLLATAFVSIPALLAARANAIEAISAGPERLDASVVATGAVGMMSISLLAILFGVYERRVARRYRSQHGGLLAPFLGVAVQLVAGAGALSVVYALTPGFE